MATEPASASATEQACRDVLTAIAGRDLITGRDLLSV